MVDSKERSTAEEVAVIEGEGFVSWLSEPAIGKVQLRVFDNVFLLVERVFK